MTPDEIRANALCWCGRRASECDGKACEQPGAASDADDIQARLADMTNSREFWRAQADAARWPRQPGSVAALREAYRLITGRMVPSMVGDIDTGHGAADHERHARDELVHLIRKAAER